MAHTDSGIWAALARWFSGGKSAPTRRRRGQRNQHKVQNSITEAIARCEDAERKLMTVEEATMSLTVADLPEGESYQAHEDEDEDWFDDEED